MMKYRDQYTGKGRGTVEDDRTRTNYIVGHIKSCKQMRTCLRGIGPGGCVVHCALRSVFNYYTRTVVLTSRCYGVLLPAWTGYNLMIQCCDVGHYDDHTCYYSLNAMHTSKASMLDYLVTVKLVGGVQCGSRELVSA